MSQNTVIDIVIEALITAMKIASPALLAIMFAGIIISLFQAATQINEQTLSFIPKILALTFALIFAGPWILQTMLFFTSKLLTSIPTITR
jgi:flagellar biosynthetic protein FliQ